MAQELSFEQIIEQDTSFTIERIPAASISQTTNSWLAEILNILVVVGNGDMPMLFASIPLLRFSGNNPIIKTKSNVCKWAKK